MGLNRWTELKTKLSPAKAMLPKRRLARITNAEAAAVAQDGGAPASDTAQFALTQSRPREGCLSRSI